MVSKNSEAPTALTVRASNLPVNLCEKTNMNIVAKTEMNFHGINLTPVADLNGVWLTSADVAKALHYNSTKSVTNLFNQYSDEFSPAMTMVIESVTNGIGGSSRRMKVRVFSLRGAHLLAMFARTPVAKEFRRWVLDILDREVTHSPIAKQFSDEEIVHLCFMQLWMDKAQRMSKALYQPMKEIGSTFSGTLYDMAHETRYFTEPAKAALLREAEHLDKNNRAVMNAEGMLKRLRGIEGIH
ncbi:P22AR C-terminal domain-containing protein [Erwiniaceae bacterium L1_55_4]|nr:P22AR C-terminal domain-containing protein [Erwiniaceae bacterium L1_55_4]